MALLTTGLINNTEVSGVRPSSTFSVRLTNANALSTTIRINGFYWVGASKREYVLDLIPVGPGEVATREYYAQFDVFEFQFVTNTDAVEISAWGKNSAGDRSVIHSMLPAELLPASMNGPAGAVGMTFPSTLKQIYVLNASTNSISVIDGTTNNFIGNVIVGSGPFGIDVNWVTNRIYVANFGSNNISVIDGTSNAVISTIAVGFNPVGVSVNPTINRVYVTNWGSHSLSVIDGLTNVVIATIPVGASPEGVKVNPATNLIYVTNHGSKDISVIDGSVNAVIVAIGIPR